VKLIGNRGERRIGCGKELGCAWIRNVPEEDLFLSFEDAQQATARGNFSVLRKPDMVKFVAAGVGLGQRSLGNDFSIIAGVFVEIDDR
jgi:hypothetical protein